jgi:hypothetical protein
MDAEFFASEHSASMQEASMWWFRKEAEKAYPETGPSGDIHAAQMVREFCHFGSECARQADNSRRPEQQRLGARSYHEAKERALLLARRIGDDLMRDSALREVLSLCTLANDLRAVKAISSELGSKVILEMAAAEHPIIAKSFLAAPIMKEPRISTGLRSPLRIIQCDKRGQTADPASFDVTSLTQFNFKARQP